MLLALARGVAVAAMLSAFGTLVFWTAVLPRAAARAPSHVSAAAERRLRRLAWLSLAAASPALLLWLALEADDIGGSAVAIPTVLLHSTFGLLLLGQFAGVVGAWLLLGFNGGQGAALVPAALAVVLQAGHGHALSMDAGPSLLLLSEVVHLLSAGAWLGGLLPLLLVVQGAPARIGASAARRFSPLGKWCVAGLAGSALAQGWVLVGGLPGLIGTPYGGVALGKLALLAVLLGFAAANRYRLAPALLGQDPGPARRMLVRSILVQTGFGALTVFAAALLSSLPPAMHEQPWWPFPLRPSLAVLSDADLAQEVWLGTLLLAGAIALAAAGLAWRPLRWAAVAGVGAATWFAAPHLGLLLVEAYPTSYYQSPTGFAASAVARGSELYPQHCAACHGMEGRGDGPAAPGLPVPPADLTAEHLWDHWDGEIFWWLSHGIDAADGRQAMPGFAAQLSSSDRWSLIDYVRAQNAGIAMRDTGTWPHPVQAPGLGLVCWNGMAASDELRGRVLHLVAGASAVPGPAGVTTVVLTPGSGAPPAAGQCIASDPAAWHAMAVVAGLADPALAGTEFLVDQQGWLRAMQRPSPPPARWSDPETLLADARAIVQDPVAEPAGGMHMHH